MEELHFSNKRMIPLKKNDSKNTGLSFINTPIREEEQKLTSINKDIDISTYFKSKSSLKSA